ncbi:MAG: ATPase, T2SS/T4P/T4SS family [Planctomycetaceae bacterium]
MTTSPQPKSAQAAAAPAKQEPAVRAKPRGPAADVSAHSAAAREALTAAKGMPGWRGVRSVLGEALAAGDTAVLLEARGQAVAVRRRVGDAWQQPVPLVGGDAVAVFAALRKLVVPTPVGQEEPEFEVGARKLAARSCRVASRAAAAGDEVLVLIGAEIPRDGRPRAGRGISATLGRMLPGFLKRKPVAHQVGATLPQVTLEAVGADAAARRAAVAEAAGYAAACDLVAAAVQDRAGAIVFEAGAQGVSVQFDVDGVGRPAPTLDAPVVKEVVGVLQALAGLDPKARGPQAGRVTAMVATKPWPCTIVARRGSTGARVEFVIEHGRPTFKTLADTGMSDAVAGRVREFLTLESGLILVAAPRRGGLTTIFDGVITAADRLMRDFVVLEDAAAPRPEIQNVKPFRWDSRQGEKPAAALAAALREYPHVIATCDLEDAELARQLVAQAGEGRLVIIGLRGSDAADGIARLVALGADPVALGRVLLGAVGIQLVRKLCPKCRQEYFPAIDTLVKLKIDLGADVTLFRTPPGGCQVCTGTGYLGRSAACEVAAGPTLREYVARAAEADVLRKAAAKDGMASLRRDAITKAARGVTSIEEVQRVFRKA